MEARRARTLADTVGPGMRVLVCGLNPSVVAADAGFGFAGPTNRFWRAAVEAGLVTRPKDPLAALLVDGVGMTDLVKRATPAAADLRRDEYRAGAERVRRLVGWLRPRLVLFVGWPGGGRRSTVGPGPASRTSPSAGCPPTSCPPPADSTRRHRSPSWWTTWPRPAPWPVPRPRSVGGMDDAQPADTERARGRTSAPADGRGPARTSRRAGDELPKPSRRTLILLITPIVILSTAGTIASAFTPALATRHPLLLIALDARNRMLVLAREVDLVSFFVVAVLRRTLSDPLFYLLGMLYGDRAIRWLEKKGGGGALVTLTEGWFQKASYLMVFLFPGAIVCALAGATKMKPWAFAACNVSGTLASLILVRIFSDAISSPVDAIVRLLRPQPGAHHHRQRGPGDPVPRPQQGPGQARRRPRRAGGRRPRRPSARLNRPFTPGLRPG